MYVAKQGLRILFGIPYLLVQLDEGVSDSNYKNFGDYIVMNYKLERMRKETGVSQIKQLLLRRHLRGGIGECTNILAS